jgi:hypothetical protein
MKILRKNLRLTSQKKFARFTPKKLEKKNLDFFSRVLGSIGGKNSRNVYLEKNKSRDFLSIGLALGDVRR